jgi:hypothetical protein
MTTIIIGVLAAALFVAACIIVAQAVANHELTCDVDDQRARGDALSVAVIECHRTIGELEQEVDAYYRWQRKLMTRDATFSPVMDAPSGKIVLN